MAKRGENLKPIKQSKEEAIKNGRKGGIASGEARRRKKELRECLEALLEKEIKASNGEIMSGAEALSVKVFQKALKGDLKAFEIVRDTAGQKPIERVQVAEIEQSTIDEIEAIWNDDKSNSNKKAKK